MYMFSVRVIYMCIYIYIYIYIYIGLGLGLGLYICMYIERERQREIYFNELAYDCGGLVNVKSAWLGGLGAWKLGEQL